MRLSEWSTNNSIEKIKGVLKSVAGPISGLTFDPSSESSMLLYGQGFIIYVDLTQAIPRQPKIVASMPYIKKTGKRIKKRKAGSEESNFAVIQRYRSLVHVGCAPDNQLVSQYMHFHRCKYTNNYTYINTDINFRSPAPAYIYICPYVLQKKLFYYFIITFIFNAFLSVFVDIM
jgi:hypothetical protein